MPSDAIRQHDAETAEEMAKDEVDFTDAQRPGLHISTFLRQLSFDILYVLEYVVLLAFGFSSDVKVRVVQASTGCPSISVLS